MKHLFFMCAIVVIPFISMSYPLLLLCEANSSLFVYDIATRKNILMLDEKIPGTLTQYRINGDTLYCYYENNKANFIRSYNIKLELPYKRSADTAFRQVQKYVLKEGMLLISGYNMIFCKDALPQWSITNRSPNKITCRDSNNQLMQWVPIKPQFTPDSNYFIYEAGKHGFLINYNYIYEVETKTGKNKKIAKGWHATYDASGDFILYSTNHQCTEWKIYSRKEKALLDIKFNKAFWLEHSK